MVKQTNGNGATPATTGTNGVKTTVPVVQLPAKNTGDKLPPLEDRLHRLNVLFDLQKKHNKLQESKVKLDGFVTKSNKEESTLEITDDTGNEFTTTNPVVIAEVVKLIADTIKSKMAELDNQIKL